MEEVYGVRGRAVEKRLLGHLEMKLEPSGPNRRVGKTRDADKQCPVLSEEWLAVPG